MHFLGVVGLMPQAQWLFGRRGIFVLRCAIETDTGSFFTHGTGFTSGLRPTVNP